MQRRDFIRQGTVAAGAALFGFGRFPRHLYAADRKKQAQDLVTLGRTGIRVTRLAQGTGTNGVNKSSYYNAQGGSALEQIPADTLRTLERDVFKQPVAQVWAETERFFQARMPHEMERAAREMVMRPDSSGSRNTSSTRRSNSGSSSRNSTP